MNMRATLWILIDETSLLRIIQFRKVHCILVDATVSLNRRSTRLLAWTIRYLDCSLIAHRSSTCFARSLSMLANSCFCLAFFFSNSTCLMDRSDLGCILLSTLRSIPDSLAAMRR